MIASQIMSLNAIQRIHINKSSARLLLREVKPFDQCRTEMSMPEITPKSVYMGSLFLLPVFIFSLKQNKQTNPQKNNNKKNHYFSCFQRL